MTTKYPHLKQEPSSETEWFKALIDLARFLRTAEGCPWDREQSAEDFSHYAGEEAEELKAAFESGENEEISEEFGDTFFTLLAIAAAAEEEGRFSLEDVLRRAHEKMIRRHEHVFGPVKARTSADALKAWNAVKAREKENKQRGS